MGITDVQGLALLIASIGMLIANIKETKNGADISDMEKRVQAQIGIAATEAEIAKKIAMDAMEKVKAQDKEGNCFEQLRDYANAHGVEMVVRQEDCGLTMTARKGNERIFTVVTPPNDFDKVRTMGIRLIDETVKRHGINTVEETNDRVREKLAELMDKPLFKE